MDFVETCCGAWSAWAGKGRFSVKCPLPSSRDSNGALHRAYQGMDNAEAQATAISIFLGVRANLGKRFKYM